MEVLGRLHHRHEYLNTLLKVCACKERICNMLCTDVVFISKWGRDQILGLSVQTPLITSCYSKDF